jgi:hypothetical protein
MSRVSNVTDAATHKPDTRGVTQRSSTLRVTVTLFT